MHFNGGDSGQDSVYSGHNIYFGVWLQGYSDNPLFLLKFYMVQLNGFFAYCIYSSDGTVVQNSEINKKWTIGWNHLQVVFLSPSYCIYNFLHCGFNMVMYGLWANFLREFLWFFLITSLVRNLWENVQLLVLSMNKNSCETQKLMQSDENPQNHFISSLFSERLIIWNK